MAGGGWGGQESGRGSSRVMGVQMSKPNSGVWLYPASAYDSLKVSDPRGEACCISHSSNFVHFVYARGFAEQLKGAASNRGYHRDRGAKQTRILTDRPDSACSECQSESRHPRRKGLNVVAEVGRVEKRRNHKQREGKSEIGGVVVWLCACLEVKRNKGERETTENGSRPMVVSIDDAKDTRRILGLALCCASNCVGWASP